MANQNKVLQAYTDVLVMLKQNITRDLLEANSNNTINIDELNLQRIVALTTSLIDQYGANGYELLQRQAVTKRSKK